jgi:hypothetical protein
MSTLQVTSITGINTFSATASVVVGNSTTNAVVTNTSFTIANSSSNVVINPININIGTAFVANTTGAYHTGTMNAASYTVSSSFIANSTGAYHTGIVNAASHTVSSNFIANSTGAYHTGTVNAASHTIGTVFVANTTAANIATNTQIISLGIGTPASGTTGEIRATNEVTAYYSDARLKDDVKNIEDALGKVQKLNGVSYVESALAKLFGYDNSKRQVGVIAQEVQAVLPEAIRPAPFDVDAEGNSKSGENYLTVKYENLIPLLIEAIKQLSTRVEELERK